MTDDSITRFLPITPLLPITLLLHVLTGCATLAIAILLGLGAPQISARVVEVDSEAMIRQFAQDLADVPEEEFKRHSVRFLTQVQRVLDEIAISEGVIVVDTQLTLAGAQDISSLVYARSTHGFGIDPFGSSHGTPNTHSALDARPSAREALQ